MAGEDTFSRQIHKTRPSFERSWLDMVYYSGNITAVVNMNFPTSSVKPHRLGDLQLQIMKVLWAQGEATVASVHEALNTERDLAYTTIATMLRKMEGRGLVHHRHEGRTFIYFPAVAEEAVTRSMADDLLDRVFEGSLSDMVSHLLTTHEVSRDELVRLEKLITARKRQI